MTTTPLTPYEAQMLHFAPQVIADLKAEIQRKDALLRQALDAVENVNTTMPFLVAHELRQAITKELAK